MHRLFNGFLLFVLLGFTTLISAQSVQELIAQGDKYSVKEYNNYKALEKYQQAEKADPKNPEVLWRISRTLIDIGEHMPASNDQEKQAQLAKYQESLNYANKAVQIAPDKSMNYLRRAIANGRIALFKGIWDALGLVKDVKKDVEKAIQLNNGDKDVMASCHYVLGRTHFKVCEKPYLVRLPLGLGWGDMDISFAEFQKAVELRPDFKMYRLDYAKALISDKEWSQAKEQLGKIPGIAKVDEDDDTFTSESKSLYEQIKNK